MSLCYCLKLLKKYEPLLSIKLRVLPDVKNLVDIFEPLNHLNLILQGKNINCINNYDAFNVFVAKLRMAILELKKNVTLFPNLNIVFEKNQISLI